MSEIIHTCPRGGMVDTRDLKSLGLVGRAGSSPAAGTTCWVILLLKQIFMYFRPTLCTFSCTLLLTIDEFFGTPARAPASCSAVAEIVII